MAELDAEGVTAVQHAIVEAAKAPPPQEKPGDTAGEACEELLVMQHTCNSTRGCGADCLSKGGRCLHSLLQI